VVTTTAGDVTGTLRAVDRWTIVLEQGTGAERSATVLRRAGNVLRVQLPAGAGAAATPTLRATVKAGKPGRHTLETSYLAAGLSWRPAYVATLGDDGAYDFDASAVIENASSTAFPAAAITLVSPNAAGEDVTFPLPAQVALGAREQVKLDLAAPLRRVRGTTMTVYEPILERYIGAGVQTECYSFVVGNNTTRQLVELPVPGRRRVPERQRALDDAHGGRPVARQHRRSRGQR
jgi:hypothetical protein